MNINYREWRLGLWPDDPPSNPPVPTGEGAKSSPGVTPGEDKGGGFFMGVTNGVRFTFVPKPMEVDGRPELSTFPINILFGCSWSSDSYALYLPRFETLKIMPASTIMAYANEFDPRAVVMMEYKWEKLSWEGRKFFNMENVGGAVGWTWEGFFIHLTALGCDQREKINLQKP